MWLLLFQTLGLQHDGAGGAVQKRERYQPTISWNANLTNVAGWSAAEPLMAKDSRLKWIECARQQAWKDAC